MTPALPSPRSRKPSPGPGRRLRRLVFACALCTPALTVAADGVPETETLPDFGDSAGALISPEQEKQLGDSFMRQVRHSAPVVTDEEVEDYIQKIGMSVGKYSGYYGDFHFFMLESPVINAFAVPGGYVGVHTGLILAAHNESEIASVLAHEISHLTQRHGARMIEAASRMSIPSYAALLGALALAALNPQAGMGAMMTVTAAQQQYQINFTRENEREADRIGIQLLHEAGYDPNAMAAFFERLQAANRFSDPKQIPEYLRTHPVTVNRIAEARDRAERMGSSPVREDSYDFALIWTKLNVAAASDPAQAKAYYETQLKGDTAAKRTIAHYGYALACTDAGDFDRARQELAKLRKEQPEIVSFALAAARLEQKAGKYERALELFNEARAKAPESRAATYGYVALLNQTDKADVAHQVLRDFGDPEHRDPRYYKLKAESEEKLGDQGNSHFTLAEYYRSMGELEFALEQLRIAQTTPGITHYQRHRIDARMEDVTNEMEALDGGKKKKREGDGEGRGG